MTFFNRIKAALGGAASKVQIESLEKELCSLFASVNPKLAPLMAPEGERIWRTLHDPLMAEVYAATNKDDQVIAVRNALMRVTEHIAIAHSIVTAHSDPTAPNPSFLCSLYWPDMIDSEALQVVVTHYSQLPITENVLLQVSRYLGDDTDWLKFYKYTYAKFAELVNSVSYNEFLGEFDPSRSLIAISANAIEQLRQNIRGGAKYKDFDESNCADRDHS